MTHLITATALQDIQKAHHVTLGVCVRILDRIAHTRLSRQIDHHLELLLGKQTLHSLALLQGHLHKAITIVALALHHFVRFDLGLGNTRNRQTAKLHSSIVVVVQRIESHHLVATLNQALHQVKTDKTGRARHQNLHTPAILFANISDLRPRPRGDRRYCDRRSQRRPSSPRPHAPN